MSAPPPEPTLRAATPADFAAIAALERRCFPSPWSAEELATYFGSGAVVGFVAPPARGEIVAYALFQLLPGECELLRLGVGPQHRGRGLGRALLAPALSVMAAGGRPLCHLEVRADNAPARRLYEALGFTPSGRRRAYYDDGEDALLYRREATPVRG